MTKQNEIPRWKQGQITKNVTVDTWECDNCGFTMDAAHYDAASDSGDPTYTCPECELQECERDRKKSLRLAEQALQELRSEKETILEERIAVLNEFDSNHLRLEAAEQERDKLIGNINLAIGVLNMMQSGRFDKQTVIDMLERIIKEGSKPDATE